ncbi:hypothetical protein [Candidatus Hodarchaeum mangrovi]
MEDFDSALDRFKKVFDHTRLLAQPKINNILIVLDETEDREDFIFDFVQRLNDRLTGKVSFMFLLAVRSYFMEAEKANIKVKTLSELLERVKTRFLGDADLFDVIFFPDQEKTPYERISEIIERRKVELVIIPVPFTSGFVEEEKQSKSSLGVTIDKVIENVLLNQNIPILFVRKDFGESLKHISILVRETTFRQDILGWIITLSDENAMLDVYAAELPKKELSKLNLLIEIILENLKELSRPINIEIKPGEYSLNYFCSQEIVEANSLIMFQLLRESQEDSKSIISALCNQVNNTLILPQEKNPK